jgi:hypothetical protein
MLALLLSAMPLGSLRAQSTTISGPAGSGQFGSSVTVLPNGNYVVTDPGFDNGTTLDVGAVYLYNGNTNALISTLTGSANGDRVGYSGVVVLANGNFVVCSPLYRNGAVTWGSGTTGVSGVVSAANSLVSATFGTQVGSSDSVTPLPNGNYVVSSPSWNNGAATGAGAVTWGNGATGVSGTINAANSLVGTSAGDHVGSNVIALPNGNYVVSSTDWRNGAAANAGAVTWASGTTGRVGPVSAANSLVGSASNDRVGSIIVLANSNYLVHSANWDNGLVFNAGAVTWGNGTTGIAGAVSAANSLVGTTDDDQVGRSFSIPRITALTNGNYVVGSPNWDNGAVADAGAVTWGSGTTGVSGPINATNSLVGIKADDALGNAITALTNGNYVVSNPDWDNGTIINAGAATWGNGAAGVVGAVSAANSLVGTKANDRVGMDAQALSNGNYVVKSLEWDNGTAIDAGAATWGNGSTGLVGTLSVANSLVGTTSYDAVGNLVVALTNGNYLVSSSDWDNGAITNAGAATWGNGTAGTAGAVSAANSLVGTKANDRVGIDAVALTNGNYVVRSPFWDNGATTDAGAATWGNGTAGVSGPVNAANSLVGTTANDNVGSSAGSFTALANGNYVVGTRFWDNGAVANVGAVTWGNGTTGIAGAVSAANSLVGTSAGDQVGVNPGVTAFANSNYVVHSFSWDNGPLTDAGAVTLGIGTGATTGSITGCNSVVGSTSFQGGFSHAYNPATATLVVGLPAENKVVIGVGAPPAPTGAANQSVGTGATVADLAATGTAVQWYGAPGGGTPLPTSTPLVDGSTYYASQTVSGCESLTRLAVTVNAPPLPVELAAFTATAQGNAAVRLAWATASEKNSATFEVERGVDGTAFARIGAVAAAGHSSASRAYELLDATLPTGAVLLYYRLRQVDQDGTASYSPVRTVAPTGAAVGLALFPNPAHGGAATLVGARSGTRVTVFDALGRLVTSAPADAAGTAALTLPAGLPAGVYVVRTGNKTLRLTVE